MGREPAFAAIHRHKPGDEYEAVTFVCPKCGSDEVKKTWERKLDILNCVCKECLYQQIRDPLDAGEED